jgi:hypothetical protein
MSEPKPELESIQIVFVGSFNPAIFHPAWLSKQNLIQPIEAEKADVKLVSSDVTVFSIGWVTFQIEQDKCVLASDQPPYYDATRDLAASMFSILRHTPISAVGINCLAHFRVAEAADVDRLCGLLTPTERWATILNAPLLRSLRMQGELDDEFRGKIGVTVEPSVKIIPGMYFGVNNHLENDSEENPPSAARMVEVFSAAWHKSLARAEKIMLEILKFRL